MTQQQKINITKLKTQYELDNNPKVRPIEPLGLGTQYIESMTSYLMRLAESYWLSPGMFYRKAIEPHQSPEYKWRISSSPTHYMGNGYGVYAQHMSHDIKVASGLTEAPLLTLLAWKPLFDRKGHGLIKKNLHWCPLCWDNDILNGITPYSRLSWHVHPVSICTVHKIPLQCYCPMCGNPQEACNRFPRQWICKYCAHPLNKNRHKKSYQGRNSDIHLWYSSAIESLIQYTCSSGKALAEDSLTRGLSDLVNTHFNGDNLAFSKRLGIEPQYIENWINLTHRPRFDMVIDLCYRLDIPPHELLLNQKQLTSVNNWRKMKGKKFVALNKLSKNKLNEIKKYLQKLIDKNPEPAPLFSEVAEKLNVTYMVLNYHFPDESKLIKKRAEDWRLYLRTEEGRKRVRLLEQSVDTLIRNGKFPSQRQVKALRLVRPSDLRRPEMLKRLKELQDSIKPKAKTKYKKKNYQIVNVI